MHGVIGDRKIMETLCMADKMQSGSHHVTMLKSTKGSHGPTKLPVDVCYAMQDLVIERNEDRYKNKG